MADIKVNSNQNSGENWIYSFVKMILGVQHSIGNFDSQFHSQVDFLDFLSNNSFLKKLEVFLKIKDNRIIPDTG